MEITVHTFKTKTGGVKLNVNGFIFEQNGESDKHLYYWVCELQRHDYYKCTARLITRLDEYQQHEIISKHMQNHNHEPTAIRKRDSEPDDPEDEALPDDDGASIVAIDDNYSSAAFSIASNMVEVPESTSDAAHSSSKRFLDEDKNKRHCTEVDDEYDAIGVNVAAKLRNLPGNMRILAEKLINDVLYRAQTNALTNATFINTPSGELITF